MLLSSAARNVKKGMAPSQHYIVDYKELVYDVVYGFE
jgi:hypothetical protein